jgi:hypothetical protein
MKGIGVSAILFLLSGCAHWFGPADGFFYAIGSTPGHVPCQLSVAPVGSSGNPREWVVLGNFRQSITINPSRKGHRITLSCSNTVVASRAFKYGRDVSIGGELAVNGSAP